MTRIRITESDRPTPCLPHHWKCIPGATAALLNVQNTRRGDTSRRNFTTLSIILLSVYRDQSVWLIFLTRDKKIYRKNKYLIDKPIRLLFRRQNILVFSIEMSGKFLYFPLSNSFSWKYFGKKPPEQLSKYVRLFKSSGRRVLSIMNLVTR